MPDWFAGVADDLAAEVIYNADLLRPTYDLISPVLSDAAVLGVRLVPLTPETPPPPTTYARDWVAEFDAAFPELLSRQIDRHLLAVLRDRERRDRNTAMLLWGVHL